MGEIVGPSWLLIALFVLWMALQEQLFGRRLLPEGRFRLAGSNSRYPLDWYTPSHIIHGFIFYWLFGSLWAAVAVECAWEVVENSPWVINRYRQTASADYQGDTILNSVCDVAWMASGFWIASGLAWPWTLLLLVFFELLALIWVRDNLTLNVLMLVYPSPRIKAWQQAQDVRR